MKGLLSQVRLTADLPPRSFSYISALRQKSSCGEGKSDQLHTRCHRNWKRRPARGRKQHEMVLALIAHKYHRSRPYNHPLLQTAIAAAASASEWVEATRQTRQEHSAAKKKGQSRQAKQRLNIPHHTTTLFSPFFFLFPLGPSSYFFIFHHHHHHHHHHHSCHTQNPPTLVEVVREKAAAKTIYRLRLPESPPSHRPSFPPSP